MWANQLGSRVSERGSWGTGEELIKTSGPASTAEREESEEINPGQAQR